MSENLNSTTEPLPVSSEVSPRKPRLGWLDALRGFTMLLVVTNHVALKSFGMQIRWSAALQFFLLFRMPLFFFISGFLAYKASRVWNARTLGELTLKKMRVQIIPTVVFFLLFLAMVPTTPFLHNLDLLLRREQTLSGYPRTSDSNPSPLHRLPLHVRDLLPASSFLLGAGI